MAQLVIRNLSKKFHIHNKEITALDNINLSINEGTFVTIVGKSGCGKTTLLKILCGLEEKTYGEITTNCKNIGIVFQEPRLMPWLTVEENMQFSLLERNHEQKYLVEKYLKLLDLYSFKDAYPSQISGGMAQRVSLGRTLCYNPDIILMDEPLGALDAFNRRKLQKEIIDLFLREKKTIIFVTHDVEEATFLGQRIVALDQGRMIKDISNNLEYIRKINDIDFLNIKEEILNAILRDVQG
ncbi:ABC transporter ATP-binding protein [Marinisporobacter balticus]|uniref:Sulfonate transport system ATP-binding protein n=1 Tax=Marinisporobacter balticus TaxID=2018667 RepID=A0A4R2KSY6_9FIRM|nr:ABC transporter ATP-binding protein [Marinisporobacter balticus]TCO77491.1 sulfonate transport system ATP-binding protein [Marinisporobacter balticus]